MSQRASVADELALAALLDTFDPMRRASIERAIDSRRGVPLDVANRNEQTSYERGYKDGKRDGLATAGKSVRDPKASGAGD